MRWTSVKLRKHSVLLKCIFFFGFGFPNLYPLTSVIFICCWCKLISVMLSSLGHQPYTDPNKIKDQLHWKTFLEEWKRKYFLIIELLEQINGCFGQVLLIFLTTNFVNLVNKSFSIMMLIASKSDNLSTYVKDFAVMIMGSAIHTFALCYSGQEMRHQVLKFFWNILIWLTITVTFHFSNGLVNYNHQTTSTTAFFRPKLTKPGKSWIL